MTRLVFLFLIVFCCKFAFPQLNLYFGNLHSHTDYTGGMGDPITAYNYARDIAQIDFLAITDHNEGLNDAEWDSTIAMAFRVNLQGGFVALTGYEWTSPVYNHVNVFNTENRVSRLNVTDWDLFLQEIIGFETAFCHFNHPGFIGSNNWDNFTYLNSQTDSVFRLIEVRNFDDDQYYIMALDNGWHVSPTNNQDNHNADWGNANDCRTGIWAESLSVAEIINAMHSRRTFSTMDKNASVWLEADGRAMGSIIDDASNTEIHFTLNDSDGENWKKIEIIGEGGMIIFSVDNHPAQFDTTLTLSLQSTKFAFIRAKQNDDDYLWSAPVFIDNDGNNIGQLIKATEDFYISPNPANDRFSLYFNLPSSAKIIVSMCDASGRLVKTFDILKVNAGKSSIEYSRGGIEKGLYILNIKSENLNLSRKIVFI